MFAVVFLIGLSYVCNVEAAMSVSMSSSQSGPGGITTTFTSTSGLNTVATALATSGNVLSFSQSTQGEGAVICFAKQGANNVCVDTSGKKYNLVYKAPDGKPYCAKVNNANVIFAECGNQKDQWKFVYSPQGLIIYEVTSNRCLYIDTGNNVKSRAFQDCKPSNPTNVWKFEHDGKLCSTGKCLAPQSQGPSNAQVKDPQNAPKIFVEQATH
eukprot:TRINITY_DN32798_c1_g1_i2.p1 TRINITY_DN32798_c1_g1~~TRINITY_DN32798_c1_g1_i2.p1  ORF type:complete len:247 (+),score=21.19 TRINITY_DN32798_c1_g1_i2:107-742(+)